jgi:branched-chain amino acid transport system permease protein
VSLFIGTLVASIGVGLSYGLLAFAIGTLYKATGIANFAQGQTGVLAIFLILPLIQDAGFPIGISLLLTVLAGGALGFASYIFAQWLRGDVDQVSLVVRTLGLYLVMSAIIGARWAAGEPYNVRPVVPSGKFLVGGAAISYLTIFTAGIAVLLGIAMWWFFTRSRFGLVYLGIAANRPTAQLLGAKVSLYDGAAWTVAGGISGLVAMLVAPTELLTTTLLDVFLLYSFTAAIIGGLGWLGAAWAGGLAIGVVSNVTSVYLSPEASMGIVFAFLLIILAWRPDGILGTRKLERL